MISVTEGSVLVGIDIGNTKTAYIAAGADGTILYYAVGPGTNHQEVGESETIRRVSEGYATLLSRIGSPEPSMVFLGTAGADSRADFDALHDLFSGIFGNVSFEFENDGLIALKNGVENHAGIVVTCGTGNTNFAVDAGGRIERIGGLSEELGDRMGAYAIAKAATSAAVRAEDGRGYPSILPSLLSDTFDVGRVADMINTRVDAETVRKVIETLFEAARRGDGLALEISWEFTKEIIRIVDRFACTMFKPDEEFRLVLAGPVYSAGYETFLTMIRHAISSRYKAEIVIPETPPVVGAVYLAYERVGIPLTPSIVSRIKTTFAGKVDIA